MKRATIALVLAAALLLSVVGCQVYNPTDNSTLYTAMRAKGGISWEDYSKKFEEANGEGKYEILKEYETFRKAFKDKEEWLALYEPLEPAYKTAKEAVDKAGEKVTDDEKKALADATKPLTEIYGSVEGLKSLWDKEYDVLWDFNGKL